MGELPETFIKGFHDEEAVKKMPYSIFGNTGLKISKLSLGTGGFCFQYGDYDLEECRQTLHSAIKSGINFIDTAPWYGHGLSEEVLGKCLEGIPRKAYYLATKVCRYEKDPKLMFNFSAAKTKESINKSLKSLGVDYVDLLQVHDVEFAENLDIIVKETLPAVAEIVKEGKARFIGITGYPVATLNELIEKSTVNINTVLSYCRLSMIENTLKNFIPKFQERNLGIINAAAHCMGLLSSAGPAEWHPASEEIKSICTEARNYCKDKGVEIGKLAMHYSFQQKGPHTHLVGMNNRKFLEFNLNVLYNGLTQEEDIVYKHVQEKIFCRLTKGDWENVEIKNYWSTIKQLSN